MSTATQEVIHVDRVQTEHNALDQLAERMAAHFPHVSAAAIVDSIRRHYTAFDGSRIRDFIPVLVERAVKSELSRI